MSAVAAPAALRGEIEKVLSQKIGKTPISGTLAWLTAELGGSGPAALSAVSAVLAEMQDAGRVTTRRLKSGPLVWKLTDKHHAAWAAQSFSITGGSAR